MILSEFAERLRDDFATPRSVRFAADDNAIQLITSQKAKGSEWQPSSCHFSRANCVCLTALSALREIAGHWRTAASLSGRKTNRRNSRTQSSVRSTGARASALRRDDTRTTHSGASARPGNFLEHQRRAAENCATAALVRGEDFMRASSTNVRARSRIEEKSKSIAASPEKIQPKIEPLPSRELNRALHRASEFVSRITPSAFDADGSRKTPLPRSRLDNPATLYGRWWHRFLQRLPWNNESVWDEMLRRLCTKRRTQCRRGRNGNYFMLT